MHLHQYVYMTLSCLIHVRIHLYVQYMYYMQHIPNFCVVCFMCLYVCNALLQEETREILECRRQELDSSSDSSTSSFHDSGMFSRPLALLKRIRRDRRREEENSTARALVIDGKTLSFVLNADLKSLFIDVARRCVAVICCRTTPIQKVCTTCTCIQLYTYMYVHTCTPACFTVWKIGHAREGCVHKILKTYVYIHAWYVHV